MGLEELRNFRRAPGHQPAKGNLEYIGKGVWSTNDPDGNAVAYPDTCVGTDSHTTMIGVSACWAGALAGSRRKQCSASRSRC